jgi:N utilization substance protein A
LFGIFKKLTIIFYILFLIFYFNPMPTEFELAINQICEEKGIPKEQVIEAIEAAIAAAHKKDYSEKGQLIEAKFDQKTGASRIFQVQKVVKEIEKPKQEILLDEAKKIKKDVKIDDLIKTEVTPAEISFGRIAAQTAKQVITQKIREAEKETAYKMFKDKAGTIVNGVVQRIERQTVFVDLGLISGALPFSEQMRFERFRIGQRVKVYIKEVQKSPKGPEVVLSRTHADIVKKLFELEVPEIAAGSVEIKSVAREAGSRTKIAVFSKKEEIDPIGACVGQRGTRVQTVIAELGGEKIDIVGWDENPVRFITNALAPAKVISIKLDEKEKHAVVEVAENQLSLAIGREGQNVRLAVKLTGWKIDIVKEEKKEEKPKKEEKAAAETTKKEEAKKEKPAKGEKEAKPKVAKKEKSAKKAKAVKKEKIKEAKEKTKKKEKTK